VIKIEELVEENLEELPCCSLEDDEFIEYFIVNPQEENDDKGSSHASI